MATDRVRVPDFLVRKQRGEKLVVLTAYDATMARLLDAGGVDALLVGDSLGTVIMGEETTLPVTLDAMVHHTRAVSRGTSRALVIADMPFLSYQVSADEAVRNGGRLLQDGGAAAVKLEGGRPVAPTVRRLTEAGVPVMGHLGLMPQSVHALGGHRRQRLDEPGIDALMDDALALQQAGAFAVVLEAIPADAARRVTATLAIPTIGIGAGADCDGQVLVSYDMLGLLGDAVPSFVRRYATLSDTIRDAAGAYADDVRHGRFPPRGGSAASTPEPTKDTLSEAAAGKQTGDDA